MCTPRHTSGIGYVLGKFPVLSETFILNEILALEAQGIPIHIFSLNRPHDPRFHEDLSRLKARVSYIPAKINRELLLCHQRAIRRDQHRYLGAQNDALTGDSGLFRRFLKGGYVADEARRRHLHHLHAHFATHATDVAFFASRIAGIPYSFTAHAYDIYKSEVDSQVLAQRIDAAKFVVTISDFNKRYLEQVANNSATKIFRIYNGIDLSRFMQNSVPPRSPFTILCVARLVEKKGLPILIEACRHLRDRGVRFQCWIVGMGPLRTYLKTLIEQWQLHEYVSLLGPHTQLEVLERYQSAHLYALPCIVCTDGNRDGLPVCIVEALACGLPVVTTPVSGIPEVIQHQQNGLLVPDGDPQALADAIDSVIRDTHFYEQLQANARASVTETFDCRQTAEALHHLFTGTTS